MFKINHTSSLTIKKKKNFKIQQEEKILKSHLKFENYKKIQLIYNREKNDFNVQ